MTRPPVLLALLLCLSSSVAGADSITRTLYGISTGGTPVSCDVTIDFTVGAGNFGAGTGTATVAFTILNTTGLIPYQSPAAGNPAISGFFFNLPPNAQLSYSEGRVLAGGNIYSTGVTIAGEHVPPGITPVGADKIVTSWYEVDAGQSAGQYGFFTTAISTTSGVRASLVDPAVLAGASQHGTIFPPLVIGGPVRFTLLLSHLGLSLDSADDFLVLCSTATGTSQPSALGAKFQTTEAGAGSAWAGAPCSPTATRNATWGALKQLYR